MAKVKAKKKVRSLGSPVTNAARGKLGQTVATWVAARTLTPVLTHIGSLPARYGIGFADDEPSIESMTQKGKQFLAGAPKKNKGYTGRIPPPPPPSVGHALSRSTPSSSHGPNRQIEAPPIHAQTVRILSQPAKPSSRTYGDRLKAIARGVGPMVKKLPEGMLKGAAAGGIIGSAVGPAGSLIGAGIGSVAGARPKGYLNTKTGRFISNQEIQAMPQAEVEELVNKGKITPGRMPWGQYVAGIPRAVSAPLWERADKATQSTDIGKSAVEGIKKTSQKIKDTFGFDNEEFLSPSSYRATRTSSPGRALMTSLRAANEKYKIPNQTQKQPEHPSKTEEGKAFRNAALEALKRANRGDTSALATALGIANLEEPQGQPQALGRAGGVPDPIRGRVDHGTRHERKEVMELGKAIDNLKGQTPQNPIGMDADEQLTVPSSLRSAEPILSPGREILERFRKKHALKERMKRAADFDGENIEGVGMANKNENRSSKTICSICCAAPCICCTPSSKRVSSPGKKVLEELRKQKVTRQEMERVMNPLPKGFSNN